MSARSASWNFSSAWYVAGMTVSDCVRPWTFAFCAKLTGYPAVPRHPCFRHASMQWRRTLQKRLSTSLIAVPIASHHHEWSNRDGLGFRRLQCEIHRAIADGTGTMAEPTRDCHHLAWTKLQRSTLELDTETPFDHEECLIGIRVEVPVVRLCHHADPDDMIIDRGNRMIVVASLGRAL